MELTREQKRLLMLYEYKSGSNAADAIRRINQARGEGTVGMYMIILKSSKQVTRT